jgi:tRNA (cytidine32/uridine32-2'-O)-methyltransferase
MTLIKKNIIVLLDQTSHPGNIGATARAMKNMGFTNLRLIRPTYFPHPEATSRAKNALDILNQIKIYDSLLEAILDLDLLFATTARQRQNKYLCYTPETASQHIFEQTNKKIGILFGNEQAGLDNESLKHAHGLIHIPTDATYPVINLSQAVQIITYILSRQSNATQDTVQSIGSVKEYESFFNHIEHCLNQTALFDRNNKKYTLQRLRCLYQRACLTPNEMHLIHATYHALLAQEDNSKHV